MQPKTPSKCATTPPAPSFGAGRRQPVPSLWRHAPLPCTHSEPPTSTMSSNPSERCTVTSCGHSDALCTAAAPPAAAVVHAWQLVLAPGLDEAILTAMWGLYGRCSGAGPCERGTGAQNRRQTRGKRTATCRKPTDLDSDVCFRVVWRSDCCSFRWSLRTPHRAVSGQGNTAAHCGRVASLSSSAGCRLPIGTHAHPGVLTRVPTGKRTQWSATHCCCVTRGVVFACTNACFQCTVCVGNGVPACMTGVSGNLRRHTC